MEALLFVVPALLLAVSAGAAYLVSRLRRTSGDVLAARRAEQPLAHELPYWTFLEDDDGRGVAVNVDLTYSGFLELQGVDTDCLDAERLNAISAAIHAALQHLPPGVVLQFLSWTDGDVRDRIERYREASRRASDVERALVDERAKTLARRGLTRSHLVLAISPPNTAQSALARSHGFVKKYPKLDRTAHAEALRRVRTLTGEVSRALQAAGIGSRPLDVGALRRLVYGFLNLRRAASVPAPDECPDQTAREQLCFSGLSEARDHLLLDGVLVRVLVLRSLPSWTEPALMERLLVGLSSHARVQVAIETLDSMRTVDELKRRRDRAHLLATVREKRNQEAEAQESDVEELIDKNLRSTIRMVRVAVSVVLSVDATTTAAQAELESRTAEALRLFHSLHGAQGMVDEYGQLDEFLAMLPGNARHGRRFRQCTSENAAHLALVWQSWAGAPAPTLLIENGRGHLVALDPFHPELDNPNAFMAGTSGSGKSATTNFLLIHMLASGAKALIIDVGGSYRRLVEVFGGQYFALDLDAHALNPFLPHADMFVDGRIDDRRKQVLLAVLERMICERGRDELRNVGRAVLGRAVDLTYAEVSGRAPLLSDLVEVLRRLVTDDPEDTDIARGLARDLRVWIDGPAARIVNRPSTISVQGDLAAFDLKGLESQPHLQSVVLLILSGILWNVVLRDPTQRKIVVLDEVWRLLGAPASARLVEELYRTSRKYACSILAISQSVDDFTRSPIAPALVNNSATVYLLRHRQGHESVAEQFRLNPRELEVFRGLELRRGLYTEALILHGEHHFLARIALTPLEHWIATTYPPDLKSEARVRARYPYASQWQLVRYLADTIPHGDFGGDDP